MEMPFDLVAEVRCFVRRGLRQLEGEIEHAVDADARQDRFLDDEFALGARKHAAADRGILALRCFRARRRSRCRRACGRRAAQATPGISRTGRRFTYWSNSRRNWSSEPQSETWSGIFAGQPTAPKKIASCAPICVLPVLGHHAAVLRVIVRRRRNRNGPVELEAEASRRPSPERARLPARPPCRCRRRG